MAPKQLQLLMAGAASTCGLGPVGLFAPTPWALLCCAVEEGSEAAEIELPGVIFLLTCSSSLLLLLVLFLNLHSVVVVEERLP